MLHKFRHDNVIPEFHKHFFNLYVDEIILDILLIKAYKPAVTGGGGELYTM